MGEPVIRILAAAHKKTYAPQNRYIRMIQAGTALAAERLPSMLHDDKGEHISERNCSYCELTVQYFAWKNMDADYYGFFQMHGKANAHHRILGRTVVWDVLYMAHTVRLALLNGYLLPESLYRPFAFSHIGFGSRSRNFYRTRQVFVVDPFTNKGYFLTVDKKRAVKLVLQFYFLLRKTERRYEEVKSNYQAEFYKLQTEVFWKKYMGI